MSRQVSAIAMSHILSNDASLSPLTDVHSVPWDAHLQPTGLLYSPTPRSQPFPIGLYQQPAYILPPSPPLSIASSSVSSVLKSSRMSSPSSDHEQTLCLPTHQVFDIPPGGMPIHSPSPSPSPTPEQQQQQPGERLSISINPSFTAVPAKRPSGSVPGTGKKARGSERTTFTKDYVPPDVSGLSKREARLVKNRAAAFLSRQRKREEFENMEIRVAELEQENARLLALATQQTATQQDEELVSEVEQLRKQLAAVQERERALADELSRKVATRSPSPVPSIASSIKSEYSEPQLRSTKGEKSGASFGLMVLLCALPTLLSMPSQSHSTLPSTFSLPFSHPLSASSSAVGIPSFLSSNSDFDWSLGSVGSAMDLDFDADDRSRISNQKLEFVDDKDSGLGALDISFDASPSENGKIRVRIHPAASMSTASLSAGSPPRSQADEDHAMSIWGDVSSQPDPVADALGPFLGSGSSTDFGAVDDDLLVQSTGFDFDFDSPYSGGSFSRAASPLPGRRRVRIALRSLPGKGQEGGEWEVEVC